MIATTLVKGCLASGHGTAYFESPEPPPGAWYGISPTPIPASSAVQPIQPIWAPQPKRLAVYGEGASPWYVRFGGGLTTTEDSHGPDEDGPFLAWQARTGLRFRLAPALSLNVGYRLLNIDDVLVDDGFSDSSFGLAPQQHMLEIGLRLGPSDT